MENLHLGPVFRIRALVGNVRTLYHHHHHRRRRHHRHHHERNQGLGLKTCSFKAQGLFLELFLLFLELFLSNMLSSYGMARPQVADGGKASRYGE
jgi:hypothetical protein